LSSSQDLPGHPPLLELPVGSTRNRPAKKLVVALKGYGGGDGAG